MKKTRKNYRCALNLNTMEYIPKNKKKLKKQGEYLYHKYNDKKVGDFYDIKES
jgi:hypothetical protein